MNNELNIEAINGETNITVTQRVSPDPEPARTDAIKIFTAAFITAIMFTVCFIGTGVYPGLSFTVFCIAAVTVFYTLCLKLKAIKNKKGMLWAVPIIALSLFNSIFELTVFNFFNGLAVTYLFVVMALKVTADDHTDINIYDFFIYALSCIFSNVFNAFKVFSPIVKRYNGEKSKYWKVFIACCVSLPVILFIGMLLVSADKVFAFYVSSFLENIITPDSNYVSRIIVITLATVYFTASIYNLLNKKMNPRIQPEVKLDITFSYTFLMLLNSLFAAFCYIQARFLFTGGYMQLPDGIVYSEYARSGFFQLLFITVINFTVILIFTSVSRSALQYKPLKILLLLLCIFTAVLIASSFYRMNLYIQVYGFTMLRTLVITFLLMECILLLVSIIYLLKGGLALIKHYCYICLVFYFIFNITGSGYFVDRINIAAYKANYIERLDSGSFSIYGAVILAESFKGVDESIYTSAINRIKNYNENYRTSYNSKSKWQTYSYFTNKGRKEAAAYLTNGLTPRQ